MIRFHIEYRKKGFTLADAFRPDPKWGRRAFFADSDKLGTEDIDAVKEAAIATAPDGYDFFRIEALHIPSPAHSSGEAQGREMWEVIVDKPPPLPKPWGERIREHYQSGATRIRDTEYFKDQELDDWRVWAAQVLATTKQEDT